MQAETLSNGETLYSSLINQRGRCLISPKKRAPRNAKNKRGRTLDCPVEVGGTYEVEIDDLSPNGEGLARIRGFSVFVANAKPGEHVKIRINRVDNMSADATVIT